MAWEVDTEPYARERDSQVEEICTKAGVEVLKVSGHTLLKVEDLASIGRISNNMGSFVSNLSKFKIEPVTPVPDKLPEMPESHAKLMKDLGL